jgi:small GTP-binding protein
MDRCFRLFGLPTVEGSHQVHKIGTIRLWDLDAAQETQTLRGHRSSIFDLAWAREDIVVSAGHDEGLGIWSAKNGSALRLLDGYKPLKLALSPDRELVAVATSNQGLRIFSLYDESFQQSLGHPQMRTSSVAWSVDGRILAFAAGRAYPSIQIWDVDSGRQLHSLEGHTEEIRSIAFSPDGGLLVSKSGDSSVRLWRTRDYAALGSIAESITGTDNSTSYLKGIAFCPTAPLLATLGEGDTTIRIWELDYRLLLGKQGAESIRYTTGKIVLVGDSGVGKTGLGWRLAHGEFKEHASTHGQQFWIVDQFKAKRKDGTECEAVLWDLAGQHVYRSVHAIFLESVDLALILFDPTNRQEPLKGVEFWLEQLASKRQLPPAVLVGARVDRGAPVISQQELDRFCEQHGISGGYISTSAFTGSGLDALINIIKSQIPWELKTATVTTTTFKRIKEYVLSLKEQPERRSVLVSPGELRRCLAGTDHRWRFTDAEMMTAVRHLENHGYVTVLRNFSGEESILLVPKILADLAASIVLQADKHPRELGALSETALLRGEYEFSELDNIAREESQVLLAAAVLRFLSHNICFRETLGADTLLIFPGLIKQKRPLLDEINSTDDVSYIVRGRVENVYAALVVLLGYTQTFTRINQWQNQAQYELDKGEICGFRLIEEREGELEFVLYYTDVMPAYGRTIFQGLFEKFLYQREVQATRFPPVSCSKKHRQQRATVVNRVREGKSFLFCEECGEKIALPMLEEPLALASGASVQVRRNEAAARLRSSYEVYLGRVKGLRRDRTAPRCILRFAPEQSQVVTKVTRDLRDAGVHVLDSTEDLKTTDFMVLMGPNEGLGGIPNTLAAEFEEETRYVLSLFDLVLRLYAIPLSHPAFEPLRSALEKQWREHLGNTDGSPSGPAVFISYAWNDESETFANKLDSAFQSEGVRVIRDKRDLPYKGSIKKFMQSIGRGRCVLLVISDKYLKSENCLFELLEVAKHAEFIERLFPVVLDSARIYKPLDRLGYVQHWEAQLEQLDAGLKTVSAANLDGFREDIDLYAEIRASLPKLANLLKDLNTLSPNLHHGSNFKVIFDAVMKSLSH